MANFFKFLGMLLVANLVTGDASERRLSVFIWLGLIVVFGCFAYAFATGKLLVGLLIAPGVLILLVLAVVIYLVFKIIVALLKLLFRR